MDSGRTTRGGPVQDRWYFGTFLLNWPELTRLSQTVGYLSWLWHLRGLLHLRGPLYIPYIIDKLYQTV